MSTDVHAAVQAARAFGLVNATLEVISEGLIHHTYKAASGNLTLVLQHINTQVFPHPIRIIGNYLYIYEHVKSKNFFLPRAIRASGGGYLYFDNERVWRAMAYVSNSYTPSANISPELAFRAARCFAEYTAALRDLNPELIHPAIPGFHNLAWRYRQFEEACDKDILKRKKAITHLIDGLRARKHYVDFFNSLPGNPDYPVRIMHCDCKISNILFSKATGQAICPVDWDTAMPGYYFSDLGDLIRSAAPSHNESSTDFSSLEIRKEIYHTLTEGYLALAGTFLTQAEIQHLHHAGLLMIYMQALRFTTDYLNGDAYYKIVYPEQNLHRAVNQFTLLKKLESFLAQELNYRIAV